MVTLSDSVRRLFDGKNFAVLSTLEPDGRPHPTVVWTRRDQPSQTSGRRRPRSGTGIPLVRAHARTSAVEGSGAFGALSVSPAVGRAITLEIEPQRHGQRDRDSWSPVLAPSG